MIHCGVGWGVRRQRLRVRLAARSPRGGFRADLGPLAAVFCSDLAIRPSAPVAWGRRAFDQWRGDCARLSVR
eukprot:15474889-Alexandrium_andersonii.AAC.1